jgi:hypothetical protein
MFNTTLSNISAWSRKVLMVSNVVLNGTFVAFTSITGVASAIVIALRSSYCNEMKYIPITYIVWWYKTLCQVEPVVIRVIFKAIDV